MVLPKIGLDMVPWLFGMSDLDTQDCQACWRAGRPRSRKVGYDAWQITPEGAARHGLAFADVGEVGGQDGLEAVIPISSTR